MSLEKWLLELELFIFESRGKLCKNSFQVPASGLLDRWSQACNSGTCFETELKLTKFEVIFRPNIKRFFFFSMTLAFEPVDSESLQSLFVKVFSRSDGDKALSDVAWPQNRH